MRDQKWNSFTVLTVKCLSSYLQRNVYFLGVWPGVSGGWQGEGDPDCPPSASIPSAFATAISGFLNFSLGKCNTSAGMSCKQPLRRFSLCWTRAELWTNVATSVAFGICSMSRGCKNKNVCVTSEIPSRSVEVRQSSFSCCLDKLANYRRKKNSFKWVCSSVPVLEKTKLWRRLLG